MLCRDLDYKNDLEVRASSCFSARLSFFKSAMPQTQRLNSDGYSCSFACSELTSFGSFACPNRCYFLFLDKKKVAKEKSRLQSRVLGIGAHVFQIARAIQLPRASLGVKQYCLLKALAASFKTVAIPKII